MNNTSVGETMENVRKQRYIIVTKERRNYLVSFFLKIY